MMTHMKSLSIRNKEVKDVWNRIVYCASYYSTCNEEVKLKSITVRHWGNEIELAYCGIIHVNTGNFGSIT